MSNGPQFFQTGMGRTYYERHIPDISKSLKDIATELKRANDLKERELNEVPRSGSSTSSTKES